MLLETKMLLTDSIFETGAYEVPSKSQNPTILGQGGPSSTQCSHPSWACHWHPCSIKIQCENKYLVLCTVSKWRVVVGAKWMVPTACPGRV